MMPSLPVQKMEYAPIFYIHCIYPHEKLHSVANATLPMKNTSAMPRVLNPHDTSTNAADTD